MTMTSKEIQVAVKESRSRTVEYSVFTPPERVNSKKDGIVYFYPLSGCSDMVLGMAPALSNHLRTKLISVNRPGCGNTSWEEPSTGNDAVVNRIHTHAMDVLEVLRQEQVENVYILGVCIGHVYAMETCRRLLLSTNMSDDSRTNSHVAPQLRGVTLVAPFVSTACPSAWKVARFGSHVPNWTLHAASSVKNGMGTMMFSSMGPYLLKKLITQQEQHDFGWTDQDFEIAIEGALQAQDKIAPCQAQEVQVGVSDVWQSQVCDEFGKLYREHLDDLSHKICIRISKEDKLVSVKSVDWIVDRCYQPSHVIIHDNIHSHEVMTFFGGPARNPVLLYRICEEWDLMDCQVKETREQVVP